MNQDIRDAIRIAGVKQWQICKVLGIGESTLIRWLRSELSPERKAAILEAIQKVRET